MYGVSSDILVGLSQPRHKLDSFGFINSISCSSVTTGSGFKANSWNFLHQLLLFEQACLDFQTNTGKSCA